ncbi:MAG TPA: hypothetical protein VNX28_15300 [Gemmataceae bacterium]|jgi:hypothetical protein|nr:hypothetical protein [Gemmataceae bacterium]
MAEPSEYRASLQQIRIAEERCDKYAELGRLLADYRNVKVEDRSGNINYMGNMGATSAFLDLRKWPTADQVRDAILDYHKALEMANNLYGALRSEGKHHQLPAPPGYAT